MHDVYTPGQKVLLHGDGPYTVAGSHRDENDVLVYALEEMRGYFWPASEVTLYTAPPGPKSQEIPPIPTEDTPERLEMLDDIEAALRAEVISQIQAADGEGTWAQSRIDQVLGCLDLNLLGRTALNAIMKCIMKDLAELNAMAAKIQEAAGEST